MTRPSRIAVVAHDAGGANAVIPVIRELSRRQVSVNPILAGPSLRVWENEALGIPFVKVEDGITLQDAKHILDQNGITAVLSASGIYNRMEHTFRLAAHESEIYSVSLLDSWLNYVERFSREVDGNVQWSRPDMACIMDKSNYTGLIEAGFQPEQLMITGAPNLESSLKKATLNATEKRHQWRAQENLADQDLVVTFFSDPFYWLPDGRPCVGSGGLMRADGTSRYGYTSLTILDAVLEDLESACSKFNRKCQLIVKPHPLEFVDSLRPTVNRRSYSHVDATIRTEGNAASWIAVSDAAIGMMSIALLEASLTGKPALSVQLGLAESGMEDPCLSNLLGYTYSITERTKLRVAMEHLATGRLEQLTMIPVERLTLDGAASNVADVLLNPAYVNAKVSS